MTHTVTRRRRAVTAKVRYAIEPDCDYAFLEASSDGGTTWTPVATNLSTADRPERLQRSGAGITGIARTAPGST